MKYAPFAASMMGMVASASVDGALVWRRSSERPVIVRIINAVNVGNMYRPCNATSTE